MSEVVIEKNEKRLLWKGNRKSGTNDNTTKNNEKKNTY